MVRCGSRVADIGTDHGYLPAWLVLSGKCPGGVAADLRKSPLENAAETLKTYNIQDKITLRLSNGLDSVSSEECDDIVLAGMGGTLIAEILSRADWIKNKSKRIIAQPNSHSEDVRKFFCENGFEIIGESTCTDEKRDYICMCAEYKASSNAHTPLYYYLGCHPIKGDDVSLRYAKKKIKNIEIRCRALKENNILNEEYYYLFNILKEFSEAKLW